MSFLVLGFLAGPGAGETWQERAWSDTVYYRATFNAPAAAAAMLQVAAVDRYTVYLNGVEVGSDSLWSRLGAHAVEVKRLTNQLGIRVINEGRGAGTGVLALLQGDSLRVESSVNAGVQPWYWTAQPQADTRWTTATVAGQADWQAVQAGALEKGQVAGLADTAVAVIAGLRGGIDVGRTAGRLVLGRIDGVNLARGRPCNQAQVTDGDLGTSWDPPASALNLFAAVDLQARRRVHRVRVLTRGVNAVQLEQNSLRGYSVQVSDDGITWSEAGQLRGLSQYAWSEVDFAPVTTQYVRLVIIELDPTTSPRVAEVQVFGAGYRDAGQYTSPVIQPGEDPGIRNFGRVTWEAGAPAGTALAVQLRSGRSLSDFADAEAGWSEPLAAPGVWFPAAEPAELVQYRVRMTSADGRATPSFGALRLEHTGETAVSGARAWVSPTRVPMGVDTTFTYTLALEPGPGDRGVERLEVEVPGQVQLDESTLAAVRLGGWESTARRLTLVFAEPLREETELVLSFRARVHAPLQVFRAYLYSPGS
ncbi:MAG: discoidin domain-containing protein, partial [Gemmatimonadota bacterium]